MTFFFCAALQNWALKLFIDVIFFFFFWTVPILKRAVTPPTTHGMVDYTAEHEQLMKRLRPTQSVEEVDSIMKLSNS